MRPAIGRYVAGLGKTHEHLLVIHGPMPYEFSKLVIPSIKPFEFMGTLVLGPYEFIG